MFDKYIHEEIEQSLLSRFMVHPEEMFDCPELEGRHFVFEINQIIFNTLIKIRNNFVPVTPKNIADEAGVDCIDYLMKLANITSTVKAKDQYKYLIEETEKYNTLVALDELRKKADDDKSTDLFGELSKLSMKETKLYDCVSDEKMLFDLQERMKNGITGISTSIEALDESINAFQKGRLYIVGARPSMGKSAFMCSLCEQIEKKHKVGIISLEMNTTELRQRIACIRGKIKHWKIEKGKCSGEEYDEYAKALSSIKNTIIDDKCGLNRNQVAAIIRNMVKKSKCEIIFVDHLGLIKVNYGSNLAHEIGENTSMLKSLSKELQIPIVCLCQINRSIEKEKEKIPSISDLRDSGRIEEDADCVILLYRDNYYNQNASGIAKYIVGKCRNGKTGYVNGFFDNEMMKWG